jgi:hypothetical protein
MANHRKEAQHVPQAAQAGGNRKYWLVEGTHGPLSQGVFSVSVDALTEADARELFGGVVLGLEQAQFDILNTHLDGDEEGDQEKPLFT